MREREREMKVIIEKGEKPVCGVAHFRAPPISVILCYKHHHILSQETRQLCMKEKEEKTNQRIAHCYKKKNKKIQQKKTTTIKKNQEKKPTNIHTYII